MEGQSSKVTQIGPRSVVEINTEPVKNSLCLFQALSLRSSQSGSQFSRMLQHKDSMLEIARLRVRVLEEQQALHRREHTELRSFYRIATEAYNALRQVGLIKNLFEFNPTSIQSKTEIFASRSTFSGHVSLSCKGCTMQRWSDGTSSLQPSLNAGFNPHIYKGCNVNGAPYIIHATNYLYMQRIICYEINSLSALLLGTESHMFLLGVCRKQHVR